MQGGFMFTLVPILVGLVFFIVVVSILVQAISGFAQWSHNNAQPVKTSPGRVVAKRTTVSHRMHGARNHTHNRMRTHHFATFELSDGNRLEFELRGREYGILVEGDEGTLSYQGTRYKGFQRN